MGGGTMAVGEEATLLPTHASRCPKSGAGHHAASQRARRVAIGGLMLVMSCALVGTLSHVSAGARYFGMQAAQKQAAATQQLYEYYEQLLDQTNEHPIEKPAVRASDPLEVTQLDEDTPKPVSETEQKLKPAVQTQQLAEAKEDTDGVSRSESALEKQIAEAEEELSDGEDDLPEQQLLATVGEQDDDEKKLAVHQHSLKVLRQMLESEKLAEKQTKHRLMVKAIAKEVMAQIHSLQARKKQETKQLATVDDTTTEQLFEANNARAYDLHEEISRLEHPTTEELYEANRANEHVLGDEITALSQHSPCEQELLQLEPKDDVSVHTQALGMLKELITKAKKEVISEEQGATESRALKTADGAQFQSLDEDDETIAEPSDAALSALVRSELSAEPKAKATSKKAKKAKQAAGKKGGNKIATEAKAPPAVAKPVVAAPKVTVSSSSDGKTAEDALAKKVSEALEPSIGKQLTAQIMQQVEKSIEKNERHLETEIKDAAVEAAKRAIDDKKAVAPAQEVTTTVEHGKNGVTTTTVTKHIVSVAAKEEPVETHAKAAAKANVTDVLANPDVTKEVKTLEKMAIQKHHLDKALIDKENAIIARTKKDEEVSKTSQSHTHGASFA